MPYAIVADITATSSRRNDSCAILRSAALFLAWYLHSVQVCVACQLSCTVCRCVGRVSAVCGVQLHGGVLVECSGVINHACTAVCGGLLQLPTDGLCARQRDDCHTASTTKLQVSPRRRHAMAAEKLCDGVDLCGGGAVDQRRGQRAARGRQPLELLAARGGCNKRTRTVSLK